MKGDAGQHEARIRRYAVGPRHSPHRRGPIEPGLVGLSTRDSKRLKDELLQGRSVATPRAIVPVDERRFGA
jgi:hypothetical protein